MNLPVRPPLIVHHMAAMDGQTTPPNSLESIRACLQAKAAFVEIDATALADSDYLLVHDPELESETSGHGPVEACSVAQARDLFFAGSTYRVPMLGQVVNLFQQFPGATRLQIDFKNMIPFNSDEPLHRLINLIRPLGERVIVSTGADWQLRKLRRLAPWLDLGFDIGFYLDWHSPREVIDPREYPRQHGAYGYWDDHPFALERHWTIADYLEDRCAVFTKLVPRVSTFYISHRLLAQSLDDGFSWADALHSAGIKLDAWTLDVGNPAAEANAPRLLDAGVDQFTTNTPAALHTLLNAHVGLKS